ncbi:beta-N-acetylglucosaminidase domain-containing protein [Sphingobacterium multivorum]|uniref:beta-N-acetylglucosaminidase domain-containing protein n=1 Tax=Sphingobacterium multivorum TaxID=28454 RepID=UPI0028ACE780|nr:beta-N-acetylglucosaminidase domain-containing protein [Sphingobacterium multivorum]
MQVRFILLFFSLFTFAIEGTGQDIYPIPQKIKSAGHDVAYAGISIKRCPTKKIQELLARYERKGGIPVLFKRSRVSVGQEGYMLDISAKSIEIKYASERAAFYAVQSLCQLLDKAKDTERLEQQYIKDFPDIAFRGTVEGFYGEPWSFEDRVSQLKFYGQWKLNTYIYGPKDDPYHSSPHWRDPYPADKALLLQQLVNIARENQVDFYWAIHPGKDIKWNAVDSAAVLNKFNLMYNLGVRHFAVFFDDISGEGTKAEKQAGLLNFIQKEFIDRKKDVGPLIMCPTEYNKLWSDPKPNTYLDILGEQLDQKIQVMWTGNSVIHDITKEGQEWVNRRLKRTSFVWWNFPVSDYVRNHLLLGPVYGLDKDAQADMSGFVSNPMDKAEASKVAIFSVADYTWNMQAFNSELSWQQAIHEVVPEVADSYALFSKHNTDPGPSYHQYRRIESQDIGSILDSLLARTPELTKFPFNLSDQELNSLKSELIKFEPSAKDILENSKNRALVNEITPWLLHFESLGKAGLEILNLLESKDDLEGYGYFLRLQAQRNKLVDIDRANNRNPYQPGIVTGNRHILPWIEKSYFHFAQFFQVRGFAVPDAVDQASGQILTSIAPLKRLPVLNDVMLGNKPSQILKLSAINEVFKLNTSDFIGLEVKSSHVIKELIFGKLPQKSELTVEYSEDGEIWNTKKSNNNRFVRLINFSGRVVEIKLERFEVVLQ